MNLGERMLQYRVRQRISRVELGRRLGEHMNTIYRIENGIHKPHMVNQLRLEQKMEKLEEKENEL